MTANNLHPDHPDYGRNPGDIRIHNDMEYKFGRNQYSCYWRAGPRAGTVHCSRDYPETTNTPYIGDSAMCESFERAADRAAQGARREYEKAKEIVRRYEDI